MTCAEVKRCNLRVCVCQCGWLIWLVWLVQGMQMYADLTFVLWCVIELCAILADQWPSNQKKAIFPHQPYLPWQTRIVYIQYFHKSPAAIPPPWPPNVLQGMGSNFSSAFKTRAAILSTICGHGEVDKTYCRVNVGVSLAGTAYQHSSSVGSAYPLAQRSKLSRQRSNQQRSRWKHRSHTWLHQLWLGATQNAPQNKIKQRTCKLSAWKTNCWWQAAAPESSQLQTEPKCRNIQSSKTYSYRML